MTCLLTGAVFVAVLLGSATNAHADPALPGAGSRSAADTIAAYEASGFDVRANYLDGTPNVPVSECKVTAIRSFTGPMESLMMLAPVDIDIACPNAK